MLNFPLSFSYDTERDPLRSFSLAKFFLLLPVQCQGVSWSCLHIAELSLLRPLQY